MTLRRIAAGCVAAAAVAVLAPSVAVSKEKPPAQLVFLAPTTGPEAVRASELLLGVRAAVESRKEFGPQADVITTALPVDKAKLATLLGKLRKDGAAFVIASVPDDRTAELEAATVKAKLPLLVLSPQPTTPDLNPKRWVFWAGGVRPVYEGLYAMDFLLQPLGSRRPLLLHDGSPRGKLVAEKAAAQHHVDQEPITLQKAVRQLVDKKLSAQSLLGWLGEDGEPPDAIAYFGGPRMAELLLQAVNQAEFEGPVLLGQGLASEAVPTFFEGKAETAWALEAAFFEDHEGPAEDAKYPVGDAAKAAGKRALEPSIRGYRATAWILDAIQKAGDTKPKKLIPAVRALNRSATAEKPVFEQWGHAGLGRLLAWRSAAVREDPACHRVRPTLLPMQGIPQIGFFPTKRFRWEPGTQYIYCSFLDGEDRTIEADLEGIGLHTKGYEAQLENRVLDDLMGRAMSKMNRLFLREPDGSAIPGVSYNITFTAEPPPKDVKGARIWYVKIAGDSPIAGGMASGNIAYIFSTFIQRTMYLKLKLDPVLGSSDFQYLSGRYRWGTTVDENLRDGYVRSLLDGYSQGIALTTAHELGHIAGCGHDTSIPRSIMNVEEGGGLEFEWAEWADEHRVIVEKRLKRAPAKKKK